MRLTVKWCRTPAKSAAHRRSAHRPPAQELRQRAQELYEEAAPRRAEVPTCQLGARVCGDAFR